MKTEPEHKYSLDTAKYDYVASTAKSVLGAIPFAGSLLVEVAGNVIPDQRIDRVAKFAYALEERLSRMEQGFIQAQMGDENFTDLLEESLHQVTRSLSNDRRQYIANLVSNSLTDKDTEYSEAKHLLRILGELNDIEIIWLRFYGHRTIGGDEEYREKHKNILKRPPAYVGSSRETHDDLSIQDSYKEHLAQLNLLSPRYETEIGTGTPVFDTFTGGLKLSGYEITGLGDLLLRQIGIHPENNKDEQIK